MDVVSQGFRALEYRVTADFAESDWRLVGSVEAGWRVERNGALWLEVGPGYRLLRTRSCGVCSTDLDRHHLPFRLPQVTGHELIAEDPEGRRYVVEINASRAARGVDAQNVWRRAGLDTHDPQRLVLGIHDLPGGFGPWVLAAEGAMIELPPELPDTTAVLTEPFAAVLHGVHMLAIRPGERVAVLGPRRLGLLAIAALAGARRQSGVPFEIEAWTRHAELGELAVRLGADRARAVTPEGDRLVDGEGADVVLDTTGNPAALETALSLARREVHVKSTHGRPSAGLDQLTALVVDEIAIEAFEPEDEAADFARFALPLAPEDPPKLAWLSPAEPPPWLERRVRLERGLDALALRERYEHGAGEDELPRADAVVVPGLAEADRTIRPTQQDELALVRPRGTILLHKDSRDDAPLARAIAHRGLRLSSSRCGDFHAALQLLATDPMLRELGRHFVTHRFPASELIEAFAKARQPDCIKAVVLHADAGTTAESEESRVDR